MRRRVILLPLLLALGAVAAVDAAPEPSPVGAAPAAISPVAEWRARAAPDRIPDGAFVRVRGADLIVGDRPLRFVGANFNPVHGPKARRSIEQLVAALDEDGLRVGRVWALGEGPADALHWSRQHELFRAGPDGFLDEAYAHLDRTLAEARDRGVRLMLTLSNHWKDYGGVPMYLRWAGLPSEGFSYEAFYSHPKARAFYRAGLLRLLLRTNTVTGVRYIDDPTIFSWELMNESVVLTAAGAEARRAWIKEMADLIRAHDRSHLVSAGLLGYGLASERAEWLRVCQMPEVDYCDSHLYPDGTDLATSWERVRDLIDDRAQLARFVARKPLVLGEIGIRTDGPPTFLGLPRPEWFGRIIDQVWRDGGAGVLVWIYEPFSGKKRDYGIYIDHPDTAEVRRVLRQRAARLSAGPPPALNPRLSAARGDGHLYERFVTLRGRAQPHGGWRREGEASVLVMPPEGFAAGRFERGGFWPGEAGARGHAYGANVGRFDYRFLAPAAAGEVALRVEARLSSEWPGSSAPPDGGSPLRVLLDGRELGRLRTMPDDASGRREQVEARGVTLRPGPHTLTFEVPDERDAHGVCIYGAIPRPAGAQAGAAAAGSVEPEGIRVTVTPAR